MCMYVPMCTTSQSKFLRTYVHAHVTCYPLPCMHGCMEVGNMWCVSCILFLSGCQYNLLSHFHAWVVEVIIGARVITAGMCIPYANIQRIVKLIFSTYAFVSRKYIHVIIHCWHNINLLEWHTLTVTLLCLFWILYMYSYSQLFCNVNVSTDVIV